MMPEIRPAVLRDCHSLAPLLREADKAEIKALTGHAPLDGLLESLEVSTQRFAIEHQGEVIAIFGGGPHPHRDDCGLPWMMASDHLKTQWVWFLRNSDRIVDLVQRHYPLLWNVIDIRNAVHMRWLRWCGFTFGTTFPKLGVEERPFREFWRQRNV